MHLTFEASITLLLAISLAATMHMPVHADMGGLVMKQKMHDLISVWIMMREFDAEEMENDFKFVFGGDAAGFIEVDGRLNEFGRKGIGANAHIESGTYVDRDFNLRRIRVGIYY